ELLRIVWIRQEDRQPAYQQGTRQTIDNRGQHLVDIGLRVQVAAKLDQRLALVVALEIEDLVKIILHPVLERIEQQRGHRDGKDQPDGPGTREILVEQFRSYAHRCEVSRRD